jgi:diketogulonate reductase-like aldo/keto reductase
MIMKYEYLGGISIPKIGFGTWRIGGQGQPDPTHDVESLAALHAALDNGYTHFDTAEYYAAGHSEELIGQAIRLSGIARTTLFITTKVSPEHLNYDLVIRSCEGSLKRLGMEYIDLYLIHWPPSDMKILDGAFQALNTLVETGKVKHLGVSNFNLKWLQKAQELAHTPLITNQVPYSLPERTYVENGVLEYCRINDILITAYSPIKFRNLNVNKTIRKVADDHGATPHQVALAWLIAQPRVITIPMSMNPQHIKENIASTDIDLSAEEITTLNSLW